MPRKESKKPAKPAKLIEIKSIDSIISFLQTRPDAGGFVIQRNQDSLEFDGYFSDEFLGKSKEETFQTLAIVIASMRSMADTLTKRLVTLSGVPEDQIKRHISDIYYDISKTNATIGEKEKEHPKG